LKYAIKDLILALRGEKAYVECQIFFHRRKMILREKYSLKIFFEA
jgi:hypothetical protein